MDGDDPWRWFVYDKRWCVIASYGGTDESVESDAKERFVYHAAGYRSSGSYIDDLILRDRDAVQPEADPASTDAADTWLFESDGVARGQPSAHSLHAATGSSEPRAR